MVNEGRRYQVKETIGHGGFGTVYLAFVETDGHFSKRVALKVLNTQMEQVEEFARRMRDEARILGLVRHRAIVSVDALVCLSGQWTVVMEYIEGINLSAIVQSGPVAIPIAMTIVSEVAGALHAAWSTLDLDGKPLQIIHRDIKPANVMVTRFGEVKLLDFGTARADFTDRESHTKSLVVGTSDYMSPEQLDFHAVGSASDVYSLGVILYELLTGTRFGRTSSNPTRHQTRVETALDNLRHVLGEEGESIVRLVGLTLAYEPADRPTVDTLERFCIQLRTMFPGEDLRFWADRVVPPLIEARGSTPIDRGDLSGSSLVERPATGPIGSSAEAPSPRKPSEKRRPNRKWLIPSLPLWFRPVAFLGAPIILAIAVLVLFLGYLETRRNAADSITGAAPPADPVPRPSAPAPVPLPSTPQVVSRPQMSPARVGAAPSSPSQPVTPDRVAAERVAAERVGPPQVDGSSPQIPTKDSPARTDPQDAPPDPVTPATGQLLVRGDAQGLRVQGSTGRVTAGTVPIGDYQILADWGTGQYVPAGSFSVEPGQTVEVTCLAALTFCKAKTR